MNNHYSVVFDMGRVLVHWNPDDLVQRSFNDETMRDTVMREIFQHPDWLELDRGTLHESDAIDRFQQRTGLSRERVTAFMEAVKDSLVPIEGTHAILQELSAHGVALYCLSNMAATTAQHLRARYTFWKHFKGVVISGEIQLMKPDRAIFDHLSERFGLTPARAIFIDDLPANIAGAAAAGFKTHLFTTPENCRAALITQFGFESVLAA